MRTRCLALAVLLLSPAAHARSTGGSGSLLDLSLDQLMALQVRTASRTDEAYFSTPAAISVITADQIRAARAESITDLLARLPGAQVFQLSRTRHVVGVRNDSQLYFSSLLLLVDGRPYYSPVTEGPWWEVFPIPLQDIERIELVRGGGGSAWGMNSAAGVVNIITRYPEATSATRLDLRLTSPAGGDAYAFAETGGEADRLAVSVQQQQRAGFVAGEGFDKSLATLSAQRDVGDWRHSLRINGAYLTAQEYAFAGFNRPPGPLNDSLIETLNAGITSERRNGNNQWVLAAGYAQSSADIGVVNQVGADYTHRQLELRWEREGAATLEKTLMVTSCSDYAMDLPAAGAFRYQPADGHLRQCSLSGTVFARLGPGLRLQAGVRGEHHEQVGESRADMAPSLHLGWQAAAHSFYWLGLLRSIQTPNYIQLAAVSVVGVSTTPPGLPVVQRGDAGLDSKTVDEIQLGARWRLGEAHLLEASAFATRFHDQINIDPLSATVVNNQRLELGFANLMQGSSSGLELNWKADWSPSLHTGLALSLFDKKTRPQSPGYPPVNPPYAVEQEWNASLSWEPVEGTLLDVALLHYADYMSESGVSLFTPGQRIPAHWRLDVALNHRLSPRLTVYAGARNLLGNGVEWSLAPGVSPVQRVEAVYQAGVDMSW